MQRQNFPSLIRFSRVLSLSLLVVVLGGLLKPVAAQTVSFGAKTDFGTGGSPSSVAVGDFNGDGKLDLAVANQSSATVSILLGTGTGSFGAKTDFGTGSGPHSVAVGDFNGDGKLDLAVANSNSATVSILLGTGTGSFGANTDFGTGNTPASVAVGDFNGDGRLDLAVANFGVTTVSILLGTGTGSFGAKTDFGTGNGPASVAVGDFNGDGKLDLAVANRGSVATVSILLGTGTGSFGAKTDFGTGNGAESVAVGDFNGDGKLDLAVANVISNTVSILLGTGTGSFGAKTDFVTGSIPNSVVVGDFNDDGNLDLAVTNQNDATVSILPGTGTGTFGTKTDFGTGGSPVSVAVGDFNGDGKLDLAVANGLSATVSILLNTTPIVCSGVFSPKTDFATGLFPNSVAVGDFNGDGKLDLAVVNLNSNDMTILLGNGSGGFTEPAGSPVGAGPAPSSVAVGDFNLDGKPDLAVANQIFPPGTVTILLGNGMGSFSQPAGSLVGTGGGSISVAVGDFNLDGKPDLAVANFGSNTVTILLGNGLGGFSQSAGSPVSAGTHPQFVAVRDFNLDGKPDLAMANINSDNVTILLGNGSGGFAQPVGSPVGVGTFPLSLATGDFNLDGEPDLAVGNFGSNNVTIMLGNGMGSFSQPAGSPVGTTSAPASVAVGDFNLDGKPDLAVANVGSDTVSILLGTGTGSFGAKTDFAAGSAPRSVAAGDFNGDGKLDLAVANSGANTVSILLNACTANPPCTAIVCPDNITTTTATINSPCAVATFAPVAGDTCPGVTPVCSPTSGSCFAVGTTTVTCTATDASGNTATCSFTVTVFNVCLQDDSNPGIVFLGNTITGAYRFCCRGTIFTGIAKVTKKGSTATFEQNGPDRKVLAKYDGGVSRGSASLQSSLGTCTITDRDTRNNSCVCP